MQIVRTSEAWHLRTGELRRGKLALVPTMGALHAGHMALIEEARRSADRVAATIFVNPLQFGANEDLDRIPGARPRMRDARGGGLRPAVDAVACDIYPEGFATTVQRRRACPSDGKARRGRAISTGSRPSSPSCFLSGRPDIALFGEKDFQQLAVIRAHGARPPLPVEIVGVPTVRDPDGLALSSRNAYLSADERRRGGGASDAP